MPPAMYDAIVQPFSCRPPTGEHPLENTPWPEGGLSKLWICKCEDQPCAAALCRASDDPERRLPVIRQCYGSETTVLCPWSTRVRQCYRRDAAPVGCGNLPFFFPRSNTCELIFNLKPCLHMSVAWCMTQCVAWWVCVMSVFICAW